MSFQVTSRWVGVRRSSVVACLLLLAAQGAPALADAPPQPLEEGVPGHDDLATKWKVDDADPMSSIPSVEERNKDPLEFGYFLQDLLMRAEGAYRKQDWKNAVKYYEPLASAVPDVARSFSRLCDAYARMGEVQPAIDNCRTTLGMKGARVIDHVRFVDLTLRRDSFSAVDADDVVASLEHMREHARLHPQALPGEAPLKAAEPPPALIPELAKPKPGESEETARLRQKALEILRGDKLEPEAEQAAGALHLPTQIEFASCRLAVRTGDNARLSECMARLHDYKAPAAMLLPFQWADALQRKDPLRARALLEQAQKAGATDEVVAGMLAEQERVFGFDWESRLKSTNGMLAALGAVLLMLGLTFIGRRVTRARVTASA